MQRRCLPRRVKSEHTAVHIYFTARRAKHTGAGGHAEPSLCSLKPRASEESRSIVSRFLCLGREEGLVEPPLLLHHLADSLRRLDADSRRRRNVSLTFPPAGWMDRVDWNHAAC